MTSSYPSSTQPSSRTPMSSLDGPAHDLADSAHAMMDATGAVAGDALRHAQKATRESLHAFSDSATHLAQDSAQAVRQRAAMLRDSSTDYIRERPMQAVLIAAGVGAAVALLSRALMGSRRNR